MRINGKEVKTNGYYAFDGCHKIYIIEDFDDMQKAQEYEYQVLEIRTLPSVYYNSCPLRFINNWKLTKAYVGQGEDAEFEGFSIKV